MRGEKDAALIIEGLNYEINSSRILKNVNLIKRIMNAEITILCKMPFGNQNIKNLEAAKHANRLVIVEDEPVETRDFTGGIATGLYNTLRKKAIVTTSARFHEVI